MASHIVASYDTEFSELDRMVAQMGGLAERLLAEAFMALENNDPRRAEAAVATDRAIDQLERQIQDRATNIIAMRQPLAVDLRHVMTVLKIANDLERVGDLAKSIAKGAVSIASDAHPKHLMGGLRHMNELAMRQLKDVLDAYSSRDEAKALAVWRNDTRLDSLYNSVFRELLTYMMEDARNIGVCTQLLFGAKNIERIGDHATNIAENIHYLTTGGKLTDDRPKGDDTSSIAVHHDHA